MDYFLCMDAFVRVAEVGNFSEVARQLNVSKSVVTSRVQQLEEFIGVPLFHRTTRNVSLSESGQAYFDECSQLLAKANQIVEQMRNARHSPSGLLRVHAIPGFVLCHFSGFLRRFSERYPDINFDLVVNDLVIDPVREGFDCALQLFSPISEELVQRKLFPIHRVFCASPEYIASHTPITVPQDLMAHQLGLYSRYPTRDKWIFSNGEEEIELALTPKIKTTSVHFLRDIALDGLAVVCLPTIVASRFIINGQLIPLISNYRLPQYWMSAVYPHTQRNAVKLKLFLDQLCQEFGTPPWDEALAAHERQQKAGDGVTAEPDGTSPQSQT